LRQAADCSPEEVLHFTAEKLIVLKNGKIQNPVGFILTSVPKCFEGEPFRQFRERQAATRREAEEIEHQQQLQLQRLTEAERRALDAVAALPPDEYRLQCTEIRKNLFGAQGATPGWSEAEIDDVVRRQLILRFRDKELGENG
jgi:hypothetical protein